MRTPLEAILQRTDQAGNAVVYDNCGLSCAARDGTSALAGLSAAIRADPGNTDTSMSLPIVLIPERRAR